MFTDYIFAHIEDLGYNVGTAPPWRVVELMIEASVAVGGRLLILQIIGPAKGLAPTPGPVFL